MSSKNLILLVLIICFLSCAKRITTISTDSELVKSYEYGILELKEELPDGEYLVFNKYDCGKTDTLLTGTVHKGKRIGKWTYFTSSIFPCDFNKELYEIKIYESGMLKYSENYIASKIVKTTYEINRKINKKVKIEIEGSEEIMIDSIVNNEITIRKEFNKNRILTSETKFVNDTAFIKNYHFNGIISNEYRLVTLRQNNELYEVFDGEMKSWNSEGKIIESFEYNLGEKIN